MDEKELIIVHSTLKLQIELVPKSSWMANVRSALTKGQWNKIRIQVFERANHLCEICGEIGTKHPVECHEVWQYNDEESTQILGYFQSLCPLCHQVKHIGRASIFGNQERTLDRFKNINNIDMETADSIFVAVLKQWKLRSQIEWKLDLSHLSEFGINPENIKNHQKN